MQGALISVHRPSKFNKLPKWPLMTYCRGVSFNSCHLGSAFFPSLNQKEVGGCARAFRVFCLTARLCLRDPFLCTDGQVGSLWQSSGLC